MSERAIDSMMSTTLEKIRQMVDVSTVVGDPITLPDGATVVPISKVAYGFASGGSDLPSKHPSAKGYFAGGAGAGVTVTPIAFIVSQNGNVRVQQVEPYTSSMDRAISTMPEIVDKISNLVANVTEKLGNKNENELKV